MSKNQLIVFGVAVAFIVLLLLVGVFVQKGRRRRIADNKATATELREESERSRLLAREQAANAASAEARARQARVEAEKLDREATARAKAARDALERADEHQHRAMDLDPDGGGHGDHELTGRRQQEDPAGEDQRQ